MSFCPSKFFFETSLSLSQGLNNIQVWVFWGGITKYPRTKNVIIILKITRDVVFQNALLGT